MGFSCLNQIACALSIPVVEDVDPDAETKLTFAEFSAAVKMLRSVGYPVEHSAEHPEPPAPWGNGHFLGKTSHSLPYMRWRGPGGMCMPTT